MTVTVAAAPLANADHDAAPDGAETLWVKWLERTHVDKEARTPAQQKVASTLHALDAIAAPRWAEDPLVHRVRRHVGASAAAPTPDDANRLAPLRRRAERTMDKARAKGHMAMLERLTEESQGEHRIIEEPPLIVRETHTEARVPAAAAINAFLKVCTDSRSCDRRHLLSRYRIVDIARKVGPDPQLTARVCALGLRALTVAEGHPLRSGCS